MTERITTTPTGEQIKLRLRANGITTDEKVAAPCDVQNAGLWYCVTHQQSFTNNCEKDSHIERGKHRLTWLCFAHGPEQP